MVVKRKDHRIVFMGTPEFAVETLDQIRLAGYSIAGVVTAPDRPAGRGRKMQESDVKKYTGNRFPLLQPEKLRDPGFLTALKKWGGEVFVVVAFRMLPEVVWQMPSLGTVNLHASLLPDYRGAAPINHVLINGEKETGVTTFFIDEKIDTGQILLQEKVPVPEQINAGELHDILKVTGSRLMVKTLDQIFSGTARPVPQSRKSKKMAPKIAPGDCKIPWEKSLTDIYNHIRGLSPYPGAWMLVDTGKKTPERIKIFAGTIIPAQPSEPAGTIVTDKKSYLHIAHNEGYLALLSLQIPGKSRLNVKQFLAGHDPGAWKILS